VSEPSRPPPPLPMRVFVDTSPAWAAWPGRDAALLALRAALAPLIAAWRLPIRPTPVWQADRTDPWPADTVARLRVDADGRDVYVRLPGLSVATPRLVADALAEGAWALRASWLSAAALRRMGLADHSDTLLRDGAGRGLAPWRFAVPGIAAGARPAQVLFGPGFDAEVVRLRLQVGAGDQLNERAEATPPWQEGLDQVVGALHDELGVLMPSFDVEVDPSLPADALRLWVNDMPLPLVPWLAPGFVAVDAPSERLRELGIESELIRTPDGGYLSRFAATRQSRQIAAENEWTVWEPRRYALLVVGIMVRRHAGALWSLVATEAVLERQRRAVPPLVETWKQRFAPSLLNELLCRLLAEQVSIRDLRTILETMLAVQSIVAVDDRDRVVLVPATWHVVVRASAAATAGSVEPSVDEWLEQLRGALASATIARLSLGTMALPVLRLGPAFEQQILDDPAALASGEGHRRLYAALYAGLDAVAAEAPKIVLSKQGVRAALHRLVAADLPELNVLSAAEASASASLTLIAQID